MWNFADHHPWLTVGLGAFVIFFGFDAVCNIVGNICRAIIAKKQL